MPWLFTVKATSPPFDFVCKTFQGQTLAAVMMIMMIDCNVFANVNGNDGIKKDSKDGDCF